MNIKKIFRNLILGIMLLLIASCTGNRPVVQLPRVVEVVEAASTPATPTPQVLPTSTPVATETATEFVPPTPTSTATEFVPPTSKPTATLRPTATEEFIPLVDPASCVEGNIAPHVGTIIDMNYVADHFPNWTVAMSWGVILEHNDSILRRNPSLTLKQIWDWCAPGLEKVKVDIGGGKYAIYEIDLANNLIKFDY